MVSVGRRVRVRAYACASKMALTAVAGYHIGHLVDLASLLSVSPDRPDRFCPPVRSHKHTYTHSYMQTQHHITLTLAGLSLSLSSLPTSFTRARATKEVSAVANVVLHGLSDGVATVREDEECSTRSRFR